MHVAFRIRRGYTTIKDQGDLSPGFERMVKSLCGLFVRVIYSRVYLVHQMAWEFLIKGTLPGKGDWQYTLSPINSSFILANVCISYLSIQEFESNPLVVDDSEIPNRRTVHNYIANLPFSIMQLVIGRPTSWIPKTSKCNYSSVPARFVGVDLTDF